MSAVLGKLFGGAAKTAARSGSKTAAKTGAKSIFKGTKPKVGIKGLSKPKVGIKGASTKGGAAKSNAIPKSKPLNGDEFKPSNSLFSGADDAAGVGAKGAKGAADNVAGAAAKGGANLDELKKLGFSPSQAANIQKSGLTLNQAKQLQTAGVKFAPKSFGEILKSPTTLVNAGISVGLGGAVAYYGAKAGEQSAQGEAAAAGGATDPAAAGGAGGTNPYASTGSYGVPGSVY